MKIPDAMSLGRKEDKIRQFVSNDVTREKRKYKEKKINSSGMSK